MSHSRRTFLRATGATVTAALAGCSSASELLTESESSQSLGMVPDGVSAVARGDVQETLSDPAAAQFYNRILDVMSQLPLYQGPTTKAETLSQFESEVGLELTKANTAVGFVKYPEQTPAHEEYTGFWFDADWGEDELVSSLTDGVEFVEETYNGQSVYYPDVDVDHDTTWLGVPAPNEYILGTDTVVKDTIDTVSGDMESLGGDLETTYTEVRSAPFKSAATVPEDAFEQSSTVVGGSSIDLQRFSSITHVAGATYHEDDTAGVVVEMPTGGSDDAESVSEGLNAALIALESAVEDPDLRDALDRTSVSTDGSTVVAEASGPVDKAAAVIEVLFRRLYGL